ncbi:MAG TPA: nicotinate-nucleotide adenylyltransferase [Gemmataceae bacterium]
MRIGIFGGTFNPVHIAHLILAEQAREAAGLDEVRFIPAPRPPHKEGEDVTPFERRAEMLRLALAGRSDFVVDEIEKERPGPSYTADTLAELHRRHPGNELFLMIGSDCLPDLPGWHEPLRIIDQAALVIVARPGVPLWTHAQLAAALKLDDPARLRMRVVDWPLIDIASRDLRRRVAEGRSIRYMVPRAVEVYIHEKKLYRE